MFNSDVAALQMAVIHVFLSKHPEVFDEVLEVSEVYKNKFFTPYAEVYSSSGDAFEYLKKEVIDD